MRRKRDHRNGFSLLELMVVMAIILILATIGNVGYRESILRARESAAIQHMQTLEKAQTQFYGVYRKYAPSLEALANANLIPEHLASGVLGGYRFQLHAETDAYELSARPEQFGKSGKRSFHADESLVIRQTDQDREAAPKDPPL